VNEELRTVMARSFGDLREQAQKHRCSLRTAAFVLGVQRVERATDLRGV
jgi:glutamate dehydrogenase/leucine dehydrogenase